MIRMYINILINTGPTASAAHRLQEAKERAKLLQVRTCIQNIKKYCNVNNHLLQSMSQVPAF